jgi:3',5'-nucleoside bisphosphate phosphatase
MNKIDLHVHSQFSNDGELGVKEIIDKCSENNISVLSITDHNSVAATSEASQICQNKGIKFIPGIEIDCSYKGTDIHLLGYNIDWQSTDFVVLEKSFRHQVMEAFPKMIRNLEKSGIKVNSDEVLEKADGKLPCEELIAEVLLSDKKYHSNIKLSPYLKGGNRSDMPYINFYLDFFAQGKPAYVKIELIDYHDAVEIIKSNNGTPIVAHPGMNLKGKEEMILELMDNGACGLEVFNNYHNKNQVIYFAEIAVQNGLIMTCGSDFHGKNKPLIDIGNYYFDKKYLDYLIKSTQKL